MKNGFFPENKLFLPFNTIPQNKVAGRAKTQGILNLLFKETVFINIVVFSFIALACFEIFTGMTWTAEERGKAWFFKDVVCLGLIHAGFTFFLLFELTPFKLWRTELNHQRPRRILSFEHKLPVLYAAFFAYYFFQKDLPYNLGITLVFSYTYYHQLKQHLGLFLEANLKNPYLNKDSATKMRRIEGVFFHSLIPIAWVYAGLFSFPFMDFIYIQLAYIVCFAVYGISIYLIFGPKVIKSKLIYFPRLLLYPLLPVSSFAVIGIAAVHGVEYFFVSKRLISSEKSFSPKKFYSFGAFLCLLVIIGVVLNNLIIINNVQLPDIYSRAAFGFLGGFLLLHHYLDGKIFKMKDPLIKKHIAPAMKAKISVL